MSTVMDEQPLPADDQWPWNAALWRGQRAGPTFGSIHIMEGVREYCTQCAEMIFPQQIACLVNLRVGRKWLRLHFHGACYVAWEQGRSCTAPGHGVT